MSYRRTAARDLAHYHRGGVRPLRHYDRIEATGAAVDLLAPHVLAPGRFKTVRPMVDLRPGSAPDGGPVPHRLRPGEIDHGDRCREIVNGTGGDGTGSPIMLATSAEEALLVLIGSYTGISDEAWAAAAQSPVYRTRSRWMRITAPRRTVLGVLWDFASEGWPPRLAGPFTPDECWLGQPASVPFAPVHGHGPTAPPPAYC